MKLIIGLGNPGKEYEKTRHNVGFMALDHYLSNEKYKKRKKGLYIKKKLNDEEIIFLKPMKYMNNSGEVVRAYVDFYKINTNDILVIYDDVNFEVGNLRIKRNGTDGGHNGIKNIINNLNTKEIKRIKIGISKNKNDLVNYVTSNFSKKDLEELNNTFKNTDNIINDFIFKDFEYIMNKYNRY